MVAPACLPPLSSPQTSGLRAEDFCAKPVVGQALIDKIDPRPAETRAAVLASALKGGHPMWLLGTFPNVFYAELKPFARRIPGGQGLIIGDSHPNNFGFVQINGKAIYAPNDFDDGGWGPVALDALHYFTAVQATFNDTALTDRLIAEYVRCSTSSKSEPRGEPAGGAPNWQKLASDMLAKYTVGDAFKLPTKALNAIASPATKAKVTAAVASALPKLQVLDGVEFVHNYGGSGGYQRYWVLAKNENGEREIIELKQAGAPAVGQYEKQALSGSLRLQRLKAAFWDGAAPNDDHIVVSISGVNFELRRKMRMGDVEVEEMSPTDRETTLLAQAHRLADLHRSGWGKTRAAEMTRFLLPSTQTLATQWSDAAKALSPK